MKYSKIYLTISIVWIIVVGYLVWANGLYARGDKSFRLDEWIWFGIVLALAPYLFGSLKQLKIYLNLDCF